MEDDFDAMQIAIDQLKFYRALGYEPDKWVIGALALSDAFAKAGVLLPAHCAEGRTMLLGIPVELATQPGSGWLISLKVKD